MGDSEDEQIVNYEEVEEDLAEIEARQKQSTSGGLLITKHEVLPTKRGLKRLDHLREQRITDAIPLFASKIWKKKRLAKLLHGYFTYALYSAVGTWDPLESEELDSITKAFTTINELNEEICGNLTELAGFPNEYVEATKKFSTLGTMELRQYVKKTKKFGVVKVETSENDEAQLVCQGFGHHGSSQKRATCSLVLGNFASNRNKTNYATQERATFLLCDRHFSLCKVYFELTKMDRNFYHNAQYQLNRFSHADEPKTSATAKERVARITEQVYDAIIAQTLGLYHRLLIFGKPEQLSRWIVEPYDEQEKRLREEVDQKRREKKSKKEPSNL
ncbi:unnamed protein product, partial [Mesorhabditis belari]|uniref:Uncharacterized protein n=1 Tax=Mesorhabditis belari TaxID=2138241 RepID=A0AAF3FEW8_9BILA